MKLHRIRAMLNSYWYITISSADRIFDVLYWPMLDILIWGFMTHFIQGISDFNLITAIMGGIVLWVFVWRASQDVVVYLLENYWSRNVYHLFVTPLRNSELIVSLSLLGIVRSLASFVLLNLAAYGLYSFNLFTFNPLYLTLFIAILLLFAWGIGIMISSLIVMYGTRIQVLAWSVVWIIQPFSCVFYPLDALPPWAAGIARILPTTYVFEGLRSTLKGGTPAMGSILYSLVFTLVFLVVMSFFFSFAVHKAKKDGSFAKPE